ncbi:TrkH family potassium uptake protein [Clostridium sp.]|uniref:TrkH family potassium uptake protein n=1 Tax=Clostridium sp. TaxID=1506 RepID=UPI002624A860|nr:TrkH family potassium uptake protein [Clostridium sp.]
MQFKIKSKIKLQGVQILVLGFICVILVGATLLSLPISSKSGEATNFLDAAFTATSATCVTGLTTLNTIEHWNIFGQVIIMLLIEIGALGFMSFALLFSIAIGKKITLRERLLMKEALNTFSIQGLVKMVKYVISFTLLVQFFGALLLSTQFVSEYGIVRGMYYSIFHAVSSFGNAGFDLFGDSLIGYNSNIVVITVISTLIIIGGLGFTVWSEIYEFKGLKKLSIHSKIVIITTLILIFGGTFLIFLFEHNNPGTLGNMTLKDKILNSAFASISPRTAGFLSININNMTTASKFLTILLMFIGGSPGSTAGGLKTVTFAMIFLTVRSVIKGREDTEAFERRFSKELIYKVFTLLFLGVSLLIVVTMLLTLTEKGVPFLTLLYEATSALGTVGLTLDLTANLTNVGKLLIMSLMYIGRLGPLTVLLALRRKDKKTGYKYPEAKILIG